MSLSDDAFPRLHHQIQYYIINWELFLLGGVGEGRSDGRHSRPAWFISVQENEIAAVDRNSRHRADKSFQL